MDSRRVTAALAALAIFGSGCGAIFTESSRQVSFNSDPPGAEVLVDGVPIGRTPMQAALSNRKSHTVVIQNAKTNAITCQLGASVGAGWIVLDILLGLVPVIIDAATNGWTTLDQDACYARLVPASAPERAPALSSAIPESRDPASAPD